MTAASGLPLLLLVSLGCVSGTLQFADCTANGTVTDLNSSSTANATATTLNSSVTPSTATSQNVSSSTANATATTLNSSVTPSTATSQPVSSVTPSTATSQNVSSSTANATATTLNSSVTPSTATSQPVSSVKPSTATTQPVSSVTPSTATTQPVSNCTANGTVTDLNSRPRTDPPAPWCSDPSGCLSWVVRLSLMAVFCIVVTPLLYAAHRDDILGLLHRRGGTRRPPRSDLEGPDQRATDV
ncbi:uncharacterized protein [Lepisosteus oculatus]|uniref:uncharacterized protein n=1 Tax=Lepisosteus oculatus TaxID=7918 RepID=UPI0035F505A4